MDSGTVKSLMALIAELASFKGQLEGLRAENKCLREDRDAWKQMAMQTGMGKGDGAK